MPDATGRPDPAHSSQPPRKAAGARHGRRNPANSSPPPQNAAGAPHGRRNPASSSPPLGKAPSSLQRAAVQPDVAHSSSAQPDAAPSSADEIFDELLAESIDELVDATKSELLGEGDEVMGGENAHKKRSIIEAEAAAEVAHRINFGRKDDPMTIINALPEHIRDSILGYPAAERANVMNKYLDTQLATLPTEQQADVLAQDTPLDQFYRLRDYLIQLMSQQS